MWDNPPGLDQYCSPLVTPVGAFAFGYGGPRKPGSSVVTLTGFRIPLGGPGMTAGRVLNGIGVWTIRTDNI